MENRTKRRELESSDARSSAANKRHKIMHEQVVPMDFKSSMEGAESVDTSNHIRPRQIFQGKSFHLLQKTSDVIGVHYYNCLKYLIRLHGGNVVQFCDIGADTIRIAPEYGKVTYADKGASIFNPSLIYHHADKLEYLTKESMETHVWRQNLLELENCEVVVKLENVKEEKCNDEDVKMDFVDLTLDGDDALASVSSRMYQQPAEPEKTKVVIKLEKEKSNDDGISEELMDLTVDDEDEALEPVSLKKEGPEKVNQNVDDVTAADISEGKNMLVEAMPSIAKSDRHELDFKFEPRSITSPTTRQVHDDVLAGQTGNIAEQSSERNIMGNIIVPVSAAYEKEAETTMELSGADASMLADLAFEEEIEAKFIRNPNPSENQLDEFENELTVKIKSKHEMNEISVVNEDASIDLDPSKLMQPVCGSNLKNQQENDKEEMKITNADPIPIPQGQDNKCEDSSGKHQVDSKKNEPNAWTGDEIDLFVALVFRGCKNGKSQRQICQTAAKQFEEKKRKTIPFETIRSRCKRLAKKKDCKEEFPKELKKKFSELKKKFSDLLLDETMLDAFMKLFGVESADQ